MSKVIADPEIAAIVATVFALAVSPCIDVVAAGIEIADHPNILRERG